MDTFHCSFTFLLSVVTVFLSDLKKESREETGFRSGSHMDARSCSLHCSAFTKSLQIVFPEAETMRSSYILGKSSTNC